METTLSPLSTAQVAQAFEYLVHRRRATPHFTGEEVPGDVIETALALAAQAPSGYNFQPWRFLVLRDALHRRQLQEAAFNQAKITEAPVVVIAFAQREGWKDRMDEIIQTRAQLTGREPDDPGKLKRTATGFVAQLTPAVWLNRQVMIAFTYLMLAFESLGWDTAPMEGFDAAAVKTAFALPADAEVVALLAVGRAQEPPAPHPGRLPVGEIAFRETHGLPFPSTDASES